MIYELKGSVAGEPDTIKVAFRLDASIESVAVMHMVDEDYQLDISRVSGNNIIMTTTKAIADEVYKIWMELDAALDILNESYCDPTELDG